MDKQVIELAMEKETKNTVRYAADSAQGPAACRTIYIEKWALGTPPPDRVRVTVESVADVPEN